jgi:hypothetical protein
MKALIQEIPTRRFYQFSGVWTADIQRASDFRTASAALEFATKSQLKNVQVLLTEDLKQYQAFPIARSIRDQARPSASA